MFLPYLLRNPKLTSQYPHTQEPVLDNPNIP